MAGGLFSGVYEKSLPGLRNNIMLGRVRAFDWAATGLGKAESWPDDVRCMCRTVLLSSMPMTILLGDRGLAIFNDAALAIFGKGAEGLLGCPVEQVLPQVASTYLQMLGGVIEGHAIKWRQVPFGSTNSGRGVQVDLDCIPIFGPLGQFKGALLVAVETPEQPEPKMGLPSSRERLDTALSASGIVGTWEVDFATEMVRSDERYALLHGVDPELARVGVRKEEFIQGIHPDDRKRVMLVFDRAKGLGEYRCLHRVIGKQGIRWIVASGRVVLAPNSGGTPTSFTGVVVDITDQVASAQDALRESEEGFTKAFRLAPVPTALSIRYGLKLLEVNDAFTTVLGFSEDEVVGKAAPDLPFWVSVSSQKELTQQIERKGSFQNMEARLRTKHEEVLDCLISSETLTIRGTECVLTTIQDITERKRTEVELAAAIEAVMKDASWFSRNVIEKLANLRRPGGLGLPATELSNLTPREVEVLGLVFQGLSDSEIVKQLKVSRNTVRNHLARIYNKADVHSRASAIVWARERGFTGSMSRRPGGTTTKEA